MSNKISKPDVGGTSDPSAAPNSLVSQFKRGLDRQRKSFRKIADYYEVLKLHMNTGGPDDLPPRDPSVGILCDVDKVTKRLESLPEEERRRVTLAAQADFKRIFSE